ncbi:hypothetical protein SK3146_05446 [Paenibacillus konkukensis]|uniref:Uncharacterized protein n=1 Tax=Paenibacillus konkukensis TaxID=2020716 RepID=A0ABY4RU77_9BACL|nr:hypothetical protein [Paenibacillus konkukensis]UQZ86154.1 hypothetical protein SK3146_05446 [Paenibacillus konkukensis]
MYIKEIAASLYPWDLHDEGADACVGNLMEHADVNSVYLVGIMHKEKRPLRGLYYPHNPKRKFYLPEDSRVYYRMDENNFRNTPLKPIYSSVEWLKGTDWLDTLIESARKNGLKAGCEISHTIFDAKVAMSEFPYTMQRNVKGEIVGNIGKLLCPNNDHVREYILALFYDTAKNHDIDFIQSCLILFHEGARTKVPNDGASTDHELDLLIGSLEGGCFCDSCKAKAQQMGYDWEKITADLSRLYDMAKQAELGDLMEKKLLDAGNLTAAGFLLENPSLYQWLEFRQKSITSLFQGIYARVKEANPKVEFRYNTYLKYPEMAGLSFSAIKDYIDSVRESDYAERLGDIAQLRAKREKLMKIRRGIGYEKDLIAAVDVRPTDKGESNEQVLRTSVNLLSNYGIDGISLGHYDEATFSRLKAVKDGMADGEIQLFK